MNITQLKYLKELYTIKSFSKAADKLAITQPALSLQIQKLEEELEFKLLARSRPIEFTEEGQLFYEKSVEILQQVEQLKQISFKIGEEIKGTLKVGIIPTVSPYLIPLFIQELNSEYPLLKIEVFELRTEEIISEMKFGNIDCGIISTPVSARNLTFIPLFYERFFVYVSENHPLFKNDFVSLNEISEVDIWYLQEGNCFRNQVNSICNFNQQRETSQNLIYNSNSIESLRRIVEYRNGITFIPELATINIPVEKEDLIKEISENQPVREISLIISRNSVKERQIAAIQKIILKSIPKRMQEKPDLWIVDTLL